MMMGTRALLLLSALVTSTFLSCFCREEFSDVALSAEAARNISFACSATRFQELCMNFTLSSPEAADAAQDPAQFVKLTIRIALSKINQNLKALEEFRSSQARRLVLEDVRELLGDSRDLLVASINEDIQTNTSISNLRHWLSAALTYNNDCAEFLARLDPKLVTRFRNFGIPLLSNALWITDAFSTSPNDFTMWPDKENWFADAPTPDQSWNASEAEAPDQLWKEIEAAGAPNQPWKGLEAEPSYEDWRRKWEQYDRLTGQYLEESFTKFDAERASAAIVSHDPGFGTHTTIQSAVDDAPENLNRRYIIYIRAGVYNELVRIPSTKTMIGFIGDGIDETILTGNLSTAMNITTYRTPTLAIAGNGFLARDITVENTAGPYNQAVAMRVDSDMSAFHRCSFWGFQDTLYTHAYRQFYRDCSIYGTIDFIFGNAASIFQNCNIQIRPGAENRSTSTVTAQGRTDPAQDTAFVCQSCVVTATPEYIQAFLAQPERHSAYLGRPWKTYARAIFIDSFLDMIIDSAGWIPWNGTENLETSILAEFRDYGPGANPRARVSWSTQLDTYSALQYSVRGFIQGGFWLPFTGVPYRLVF